MKQRIKSLAFTILRMVLGIGIAIFLISKTMEKASLTPSDLWQKICGANTFLLIFSILLYGLDLVLGAWRWQLLLNAQDISTSWFDSFKLTLVGFFFNLAVPGAVGGDVVKMGYLAKSPHEKVTEGIFSIIVDRIIGVLGLFFIAAVCVLISLPELKALPPESAFIRNAAFLVGLGSIGGIFALLGLEFHDKLIHLPGLRKLWPVIERFMPHKIVDTATRLITALDIYRRNKPILLLTLGISLVIHTVLALDLYTIGRSMHESDVPAREYFLTTQVANAIASVPVTPGGVGLRDRSNQEFFSAFGMSEEAAAIIPITLTFIILIWAMIGLLVFVTGPGSHHSPRRNPD